MVVGEFTQETNVVVIGGGPGGYTAAFRAAELGLQVAIVDPREQLGGVCLHEGCVPSKTLLSIADAINTSRDAAAFGVEFDQPRIDLEKVRSWVNQSVGKLAAGLASLAKKHQVELLRGEAVFEDSKHIAIRGGSVPRVKFKKAIIATGSSPLPHPAAPFDGSRILTPHQAVRFASIPASVLIVGSGYQAVELAGIYAALGAKVTLIDESDRLIPDADADLARPLTRRLPQHLAAMHLSTRLKEVDLSRPQIQVVLASGAGENRLEIETIIVAIGQMPNTSQLGLNHTQVKFDERGYIIVNEQMITSDARILAVGDVTGLPLLADKAIVQGRIAAETVAGWGTAYDARVIPMVVFSDPQIAWCGLTEQEAKAQSRAHDVIKIPWGASGRTVGMGRADGLTKLIIDPDTKLVLGVGLTGPGAAEMIGEAALAIEMGAVAEDLAATMHPHPTMSELIADAARTSG